MISLLFVSLWHVVASQPPHLPGISVLGSSFELLTASRDGIDTAIGNLFIQNYNSTTDDGLYSVPWGALAGADPECDRSILSTVSQDSYTYDSTRNDGTSIGGKFGKFSGSFSESTTHVHNVFREQDVAVTASRTKCRVYTVTMLPGYAALNPLFVGSVEQLPETYDDSSKGQYQDFIKLWQTHVATRCIVGGVMEQQSITQKTYLKTHDENKVESEAKASFIISIDKTHSSDIVVDQDFQDSTTEEGIVAHGGEMATDDQWATWAQSVQQLKSPACLDWTAIELPDVLLPPWSPAGIPASSRVDALRAALDDWFYRPGCTDPDAVNYNPAALQNDGSCRHLPSFSFTNICRCYGFNDDYTYQCGTSCTDHGNFNLGFLANAQIADTTPLYWCKSKTGHEWTISVCDNGSSQMQFLGYIWSNPNATLGVDTPLYQCMMGEGNRFDDAGDATCGGCTNLGSIHGYVSMSGAIPGLDLPGLPRGDIVVV